jgi:hypothetical protein
MPSAFSCSSVPARLVLRASCRAGTTVAQPCKAPVPQNLWHQVVGQRLEALLRVQPVAHARLLAPGAATALPGLQKECMTFAVPLATPPRRHLGLGDRHDSEAVDALVHGGASERGALPQGHTRTHRLGLVAPLFDHACQPAVVSCGSEGLGRVVVWYRPVSTTNLMPSMVIDVSAIFVASTTLRQPARCASGAH